MLRQNLKNSLYHTAKTLCGYRDITINTHGSIITNLESLTKKKLLCVPRGTFKSSIGCVAYPIWSLMRNPNERILIDSELFENSSNFIREIKAVLESELYTTLFGQTRSQVWNADELIIAQRTQSYKEASITAGGIGTGKTGQHYSIIIGDDYNSPRNSTSHDQRKKVIDHYQYSQSILDPNGTYVIIGTRYAQDDVIGWIMKNELGLKDASSRESLKVLKEENRVFYI